MLASTIVDSPRSNISCAFPTGVSNTYHKNFTHFFCGVTCVNTPASVIGCVFPPIPFNVTTGILYSLHDLMFVKYLECAKETEPQESSFTSLMQLTNLDLSFWNLILKFALLISLFPGDINHSSEIYNCLSSDCGSLVSSTHTCH